MHTEANLQARMKTLNRGANVLTVFKFVVTRFTFNLFLYIVFIYKMLRFTCRQSCAVAMEKIEQAYFLWNAPKVRPQYAAILAHDCDVTGKLKTSNPGDKCLCSCVWKRDLKKRQCTYNISNMIIIVCSINKTCIILMNSLNILIFSVDFFHFVQLM